MKKRSELVFNLLQVPIDSFMIIAGFVLAFFVREGQDKPLIYFTSGYSYLKYMIVLLPVWIAIFAIVGLYSFSSTRSRLSEIGKIISATAATTMVLIIVDFFTNQPIFPAKSIPIYGFIISTILVFAGRFILNSVQKFLFRFGIGVYQIMLIGKNGVSDQLTKVYASKYPHFSIHSIQTNLNEGSIESLLKKLSARQIDQLVVTQANISEASLLAIAGFCEQRNITLKFVPTVSNFFASAMVSERVGDIPVLEIQRTPLEGWGRIIKRLMDIVLSLLAIVVLSPLLLTIAIIQKLTNPGPILYLHKRISRAGKPFSIYKFRSMKIEFCTGGKYSGKSDLEVLATFNDPKLIEEWKRDQKLVKDPRISRFGRFLRRTSLDELPQLLNILRGDISIVGPRPVIEDELKRYGSKSNLFLMIKPGLTGLWQVSGRSDVSYDQRVKLDIYYIENWSLLLDVKIMLQTAWMLVRGGGGYFNNLRVAIVHDWLTNLGGAERCVLQLSQMFPHAPIYTSVYNAAKLPQFSDKDVRVSFLQHWPVAKRKHQLFPQLRQLAFESFDFSDYDLVISSSGAEAKGIITPTETRHISYIYTPTRYYWSGYQNYLDEPGFGLLNPVALAVFKRSIKQLRRWDYAAAQRPELMIGISKTVQARIKKYYDRNSGLTYPPVDIDRFEGHKPTDGGYYFVLSRLIPYKRVDLAVQACTKLGKKLIVAGVGPELERLKKLAGPTIQFVGFPSDTKARDYYLGCKAFIFPADEDFGITPVEAMAAGKPVLFYGEGGATETVVDGTTGTCFKKQTVDSLIEGIHKLEATSFDRKTIIAQANKFTEQAFRESFQNHINEFITR